MTEKKDLVYLITGLNRAGAELVCLDQARHFAAIGWRIGVIYLVEGDSELVGDFEAAGVEVACLRMRSPLALPLGLVRARALLSRWQPRVLHSHMIHANILSSLLKPFMNGTSLIWTAHNVTEGGRLLQTLQKLGCRAPDLATNVSEEATEAYIRRGLFRTTTSKCIPNGIDINRFPLVTPEQRHGREDHTFICVAQFRAQKNHETLLEAFAITHAQRPRTRLLLLGAGPSREPSERLAEKLNLSHAVIFAGGNANVAEALRLADSFILVSHYEGFGLAAAEAMASGLRIIGSDVPGLREVVGSHGSLVPPWDVDAISRAMIAQVDTTDTSEQAKARRAHIVEHYSRDRVLAQWELEYKRLGL